MTISQYKRSGTQEFTNEKVPSLKNNNLFNNTQYTVQMDGSDPVSIH